MIKEFIDSINDVYEGILDPPVIPEGEEVSDEEKKRLIISCLITDKLRLNHIGYNGRKSFGGYKTSIRVADVSIDGEVATICKEDKVDVYNFVTNTVYTIYAEGVLDANASDLIILQYKNRIEFYSRLGIHVSTIPYDFRFETSPIVTFGESFVILDYLKEIVVSNPFLGTFIIIKCNSIFHKILKNHSYKIVELNDKLIIVESLRGRYFNRSYLKTNIITMLSSLEQEDVKSMCKLPSKVKYIVEPSFSIKDKNSIFVCTGDGSLFSFTDTDESLICSKLSLSNLSCKYPYTFTGISSPYTLCLNNDKLSLFKMDNDGAYSTVPIATDIKLLSNFYVKDDGLYIVYNSKAAYIKSSNGSLYETEMNMEFDSIAFRDLYKYDNKLYIVNYLNDYQTVSHCHMETIIIDD